MPARNEPVRVATSPKTTVFQREVDELDRRRRIRMRVVSCIGATTVMIAALWSAGFPPTELLERFESWFRHHQEKPKTPAAAPPLNHGVVSATHSLATSPHSLPGTDSSVSAVPLPLLLISTSPGRSPSEGTANIGTNPTNPQTFAAGALLVNGARLVEIHKTHVILQRGDKRARLNLAGPEGAPASVNDELLAVGRDNGPSIHPVEPTYESLTDYIRPNPVYDGEMLHGYEVYSGKSSWVFSQMGLQAGDVIIALNDMPLTDTGQSIELFKEIAKGLAMTATVERKGRRERIALDGSLITAAEERAHQQQMLSQTAPPGPPL